MNKSTRLAALLRAAADNEVSWWEENDEKLYRHWRPGTVHDLPAVDRRRLARMAYEGYFERPIDEELLTGQGRLRVTELGRETLERWEAPK